jgi:exosortase
MVPTADTVTTDARPPLPRSMVASRSKGQTAIVALVAAELAILYVPTIRWLFDRWTISVWEHAHGLFIPPIVAYLVWHELKRRPALRSDEGTAWGLVLLIPALVVHVLDTGMQTQLLSAMSLVLALPAFSLLLLGIRRTKAIAFPLTFCLFALPIPLALTETAHLFLRKITAVGSATVLPYLGIPVLLEGTTLHLPAATLYIVDACSGFSTLYAAMAVACLSAYSVSSTGRRVLVLTAAAPIAIASNVLRIVGLCVLIRWRGLEVLDTFLHPLSGMLTFAITLPLIFWLAGPTRAGAGT